MTHPARVSCIRVPFQLENEAMIDVAGSLVQIFFLLESVYSADYCTVTKNAFVAVLLFPALSAATTFQVCAPAETDAAEYVARGIP